MIVPRQPAVRTLLALSALCILAASLVALTGGIALDWGGHVVRSHRASRPLVAAALLAGIAMLAGWRAVADALRWWWAAVSRCAAPAAAAVAVAAAATGLAWGTFTAGGSDSYCYLNQAELLARGAVRDVEPLGADPSWPGSHWSFVPAGHAPFPDRPGVVVPICPPGYPLMLAAARATLGRTAMFWITPLMGALAVYLAFVLGRRLSHPAAGLLAAVLTATSPIFLYQVVQPMNDVVAAALWLAALVLATSRSRAPAAHGAIAGLVTGVAITVRPNLVPLAAVVGLAAAFLPEGRRLVERASTLVFFGAAAVPGVLVVMALQHAMYGSPLRSGYGDLSALFSASHVWPNLLRYPQWVLDAHTPVLLTGLAAPLLLAGSGARRIAGWILILAAATLACYLPYVVFDAWWYQRFLLPAILPLLAAAAAVIVSLIERLPSAWRAPVFAAVCAAMAVVQVQNAVRGDALRLRDLEARFRIAGEYVAQLPPEAAFVTGHHSGSIRFYAGRSTAGWGDIAPGRLDEALAFLRRHGRRPYLLFEAWEEPEFQRRFAEDRLGRLDWPPFAEMAGGVRIYDPEDFGRTPGGRQTESPPAVP
jgi:hypothetical protein